ncbi:MAG: hypothetical protein HQL26_00570 [Candidatus Omnitrophica bacterium]|nr:hypothetical protein [Candidatus Omnitrophota bacterium]
MNFKLAFLVLPIVFLGASMSDAKKSVSTVLDNKKSISVKRSQGICYSEKAGVSFKCKNSWNLTVMDGANLFNSKEMPHLTVSVSTMVVDFTVLEELDHGFLHSTGLYSDNFQREHVMCAGRPALKIKAYAKDNPHMRYVGLFFLKNKELTSILFSVYPEKKYWDQYQFTIKEMIDSLNFIGSNK